MRTRMNRAHRGVASTVSIDEYGGAICSRGRPSTPAPAPAPAPPSLALGGGGAALADGDFLKRADVH